MTTLSLALTTPVGPGDAPLLVLGPSLGTSTRLWDAVVPLLALTHRVVAWDLPGHGASPAESAPFTVGDLADAVAAATRSLTGGQIRYAGVSLGGAAGLELVLRHPSLVSHAVIVASGAQIGAPEAWRDRASQVRARSTSSLLSASAVRWFAPETISRMPEVSGRLLHALQDADDESYARCCEALAVYDVRNRLGGIAAPVLALWGEHDVVAPESAAAEIAERTRRGESAMIAAAAHLPPAEQPHAVAEALLAFFGAIEGEA